jgi:hypothetical protein
MRRPKERWTRPAEERPRSASPDQHRLATAVSGAVAFVQRFDSALRVNLHFQCCGRMAGLRTRSAGAPWSSASTTRSRMRTQLQWNGSRGRFVVADVLSQSTDHEGQRVAGPDRDDRAGNIDLGSERLLEEPDAE